MGAASHTHTYTHTHTHFKDPNRNILIPNTQIVTPGLNLHVVQNQNSVVPPQQIPSTSIQPGFNTGRGTFGSNVYSPNPSGYGIVKPGISASQSQVIQTNVPNRQYLVAPNMGATTFTQSQTLHQGRSHENPIRGMELQQLPNLGQNNEKVVLILQMSKQKLINFITAWNCFNRFQNDSTRVSKTFRSK